MKLNNQQSKLVNRLSQLDSTVDFFWNEETGSAKFIKGKLTQKTSEKSETIARDFLQQNPELLDLQDGLKESLQIVSNEIDKQGHSHVYFSQSLNDIPVYEGSTQVHINPQGEIVAYKDYRLDAVDVSLEPLVDEEQALDIMLHDTGKTKEDLLEKKVRLILYRDSSRKVHLAWEVEWVSRQELAFSLHIIDAHDGSLLLKHSRMKDIASRLTYSAKNTDNLKASLILQDDQNSSDTVAQAAHDNALIVHDYYLNTFGRNSYDDQGANLVSTVHYKEKYNNAFWTDYLKQMVYGDGDGFRFAPLSLALDVVGHELTHAVTARTARFIYAEQAGALDESFADFFGVMASNSGAIEDWEVGEGIYTPFRGGDALRDMSNPALYGQPDHMDDFLALGDNEQPDSNKNDNGYVHSNSGIPNKAAYLSVDGGSHHGVRVQGLGREKVEQIYYLAMTNYLYSSTDSRWTFMQARYAILNACRQLYGDNGSEYASLKNAWAAVGVGDPADDFVLIRREVSPNQAIPDMNPAGISSVLNIADEGLVKALKVQVDIQHSYIGDLRLILTSPQGESVVLHDRKGGSQHDISTTYNLQTLPELNAYLGDQVQGEWQLVVSDHAAVDTGKLLKWSLEFSIEKAVKKEFTLTDDSGLPIPDKNPDGISRELQVNESGSILRLDVEVDISHTWIGDLRVVLKSPTGVEAVLHDRSGKSRHDIKQTYSTTANEAMRSLLNTEIQGNWRLSVVDTYSKDVGSLNAWSLHCVYE